LVTLRRADAVMGTELIQPNPWMILPFVVLLAAIALAPLFASEWWGRHYPKVAFALAAVTLAYYLVGLGHLGSERVLHTAKEYVSFIVLIGSLYVVSGGIHISVKGEGTPRENVTFLLFGAILANLLGTTGASMLLIRPWIRMNKYRITSHHIVFFIFIISNVGGCLTPIGDPPLFLGYLKGVPFWWVLEHCWPMWMVGVGTLLAMFYVVDWRNYQRAPKPVRDELAEPSDQWRFEGTANLIFLGVILGAVFIEKPLFLREALMIGAAAGSYLSTRKPIHEANHFSFHPIQEVAILFIGIFATMMPALDWLQQNAARLGTPTPALFYWGSGALSSVLDNAPTYLSFLSAQIGIFVTPEAAQSVSQQLGIDREHAQIHVLLASNDITQLLVAISVGSVFFGANTYIGNGPNFMVKAIADQQKVRTPSFLGFVFRFTLPFMIPMLVLIWIMFFIK
jgi:Na+/H+ antiporter NhaD/arsenite permease-like protein